MCVLCVCSVCVMCVLCMCGDIRDVMYECQKDRSMITVVCMAVDPKVVNGIYNMVKKNL
jgi:hypothetical protein